MNNRGGSIFGGIIIVVFGIIWTVGAVSLTSRAPDEMGIVKILFPLFGFLFVSMGIFGLIKGATGKNKNGSNNSYYTDSTNNTEEPKEYKVYKEGEEEKLIICPMCHSTAKESQQFCINCGNKLKE